MPMVRISLLKGRSRETIGAIADGVHAALVEAYQVPIDDRFQIVEQLDPEQLIFDRSYLGIERSDEVVVVHIVASDWRGVEAKRALYRAIAHNLQTGAGMRPEDVLIVLSPNDKPDWSFGNGIASYSPA